MRMRISDLWSWERTVGRDTYLLLGLLLFLLKFALDPVASLIFDRHWSMYNYLIPFVPVLSLPAAVREQAVGVNQQAVVSDSVVLQDFPQGASEAGRWWIAWSPDRKRVAASGPGSLVQVWDVATGTTVNRRDNAPGTRAIMWSPDGMKLAAFSQGSQGPIIAWNIETGKEEFALSADQPNHFTRVTWSPDGRWLAASASGSVDVPVRLHFWKVDARSPTTLNIEKDKWAHIIRSMAWSPDSSRLATGHVLGAVNIRIAAGPVETTLLGHSGAVELVAWSRDGERLASATDKAIKIWDVAARRAVATIEVEAGLIPSLAWGPDGSQLATVTKDETIHIWNANTGLCLVALRKHSAPILTIAWLPDSDLVASISADGTVRWWAVGPVVCDDTERFEMSLQALRAPNSLTRDTAAQTIGQFGPAAGKALPPLVEATRDGDPWVRLHAAEAIWRVASRAESVLPTLVAALKDNDAALRSHAARVLGEMGPPAAAAIAELGTLTKDKNAAVRARALQAMQQISTSAATPALVEALNDADAAVRLAAVSALAQSDPDQAAAPLADAVRGSDATLSKAAIEALVQFGPKASPAIPALRDALKNPANRATLNDIGTALRKIELDAAVSAFMEALQVPDRQVRSAAAKHLSEIGPAAKAAVQSLIDAVSRYGPEIYTVVALGNIGPEAKAAVPTLQELLKTDKSVAGGGWRRAADALSQIDPEAARPNLYDALRAGNVGLRAEAVAVLCSFHGSDETLETALAEVLNDPNESSKNRLAMMGQLPALGPKAKPALRALTEACYDSSGEIRTWAVDAIRRIGPDAAPAVDTLISLLHDEEFTVRLRTMWALRAIGPPARRAVPSLVEELRRNDSLTRQTAAQALAGIGPAARESLPVLMEMRTETDQESLRVAEAIWKVGLSAEVPVSRLVGLLQSGNASIGREAARLLGEIGPAAKPAVPALRVAAKNGQLQPDAGEALQRIDPEAAAHLNDK